jgi:hypothetical protein
LWRSAGWSLLAQPDPSAADPRSAYPNAASGRQQQLMVMIRLPPAHFSGASDYGGSYGDSPERGARRRLAASVARRYGLIMVNDWPMPLVNVHSFIMTMPDGGSAAAIAAQVSREKTVA